MVTTNKIIMMTTKIKIMIETVYCSFGNSCSFVPSWSSMSSPWMILPSKTLDSRLACNGRAKILCKFAVVLRDPGWRSVCDRLLSCEPELRFQVSVGTSCDSSDFWLGRIVSSFVPGWRSWWTKLDTDEVPFPEIKITVNPCSQNPLGKLKNRLCSLLSEKIWIDRYSRIFTCSDSVMVGQYRLG